MIIEIKGLKRADELAVQDMLSVWVALGEQGASRWVGLFVDGDGSFRPEITVNGKKPLRYVDGSNPKERWTEVMVHADADGGLAPESMYLVDPESILANERESGR